MVEPALNRKRSAEAWVRDVHRMAQMRRMSIRARAYFAHMRRMSLVRRAYLAHMIFPMSLDDTD